MIRKKSNILRIHNIRVDANESDIFKFEIKIIARIWSSCILSSIALTLFDSMFFMESTWSMCTFFVGVPAVAICKVVPGTAKV